MIIDSLSRRYSKICKINDLFILYIPKHIIPIRKSDQRDEYIYV